MSPLCCHLIQVPQIPTCPGIRGPTWSSCSHPHPFLTTPPYSRQISSKYEAFPLLVATIHPFLWLSELKIRTHCGLQTPCDLVFQFPSYFSFYYILHLGSSVVVASVCTWDLLICLPFTSYHFSNLKRASIIGHLLVHSYFLQYFLKFFYDLLIFTLCALV